MHTLKVQVLSDASLVAKGVRFRLGFIGAGLTGAGLTGACRLGLPLAMLAGILAIPCVAVGAEPISSGQSQLLAQRNQPARLPNPVANRVIAQAAQQFDAPRSQIRIVGASAQVWPDGCLGLGGPAESCLAATVKGWFVVVSDGLQSVNYRTDAQGRVIRSEDKVLLPRSVARKLVEQVRRDTRAARVSIAEVKAAGFGGCLGVYRPGQVCTAIALQGWQAVVRTSAQVSGQVPGKVYVYHLDQSGEQIVQNDTATAGSTLAVSFIRWEAGQFGAPQPLRPAPNVVFESMVSGGLAGTVIKIQLTEDGKITRFMSGPTIRVAPQVLRQLTPQQLDQFKQLLDTTRFVNLDGLSYLTDAALADYPTTEYYSANTHVRFVDIDKPALPRSLQLMFSAWNELTLEP
jgi:hypothetical protein